MFEDRVISLLKERKAWLYPDIVSSLGIGDEYCAMLNTELAELCNKDIIRRVGEEIYTLVFDTEWGKIIPGETEVAAAIYITNNAGYLTGPAYYNAVGLSTWMANRKDIVTNNYMYQLYVTHYIYVRQPQIPITKENRPYLQLLDGISEFNSNHHDARRPFRVFADQLDLFQLSESVLINMAKELYPKFVLDLVMQVVKARQ